MEVLSLEKLPGEFVDFRKEFREFKEEFLSNTRPPQNLEDEILTADKAAFLLGVAVPTIYSYVQKNSIPYMRRSKRLYFSKQELMEWLKQGAVKEVS